MTRIEIQKSRNKICSCNSCYAANFEDVKCGIRKETDTIFEIQIGCMTNYLCPNCLAELIGKATIAALQNKEV